MVLTIRSVPLGSFVILAAMTHPAFAQQLDRATPLLQTPSEYEARPVQLGNVSAYLGVDARLEYDSNIYALPSNEIDDERLTISPWVNLQLTSDNLQLSAEGRALIRRYFETTSENTESGNASIGAVYKLSSSGTLTGRAGWTRLVEQRGEPESETTPGGPPRRYNQWLGELGYTHQGARFTAGIKGTALKNDALPAIDAERDFSQYSGSARLGYRVSGNMHVFGEGFFSSRDFRLATDSSGVDRDSRTYGARAGISLDPGGLIRGEAGVGIFRFNPADPNLDSRNGLSISGSLTYTPSERWAVTLDAFRGDVATVQNGAQSRTDTRLQLGVQNEIYHNLRWMAAAIYRRSSFIGSGRHERTLAGVAEVEYLMSRNISVAVTGRVANRDSTDPVDDFDRAILGLELRLQY